MVVDLNRQLRSAVRQGSEGATNRLDAERGGFRAYFDFLAEHPASGPGEVVGMRYLSWDERRDHVSVGEGPCRQARATGAQAGTRT